jgi:pimeloyl-ACP methyl ester carboxylesterase
VQPRLQSRVASAPVTLTTIRRDVEGRRVLERVGGRNDAPPLVLVHGLGVRGRYLMPVAERLASDYRVAIPDLPDVPVDVPGRRAALSDWMRAAGIARAPLLANSLGCQIAVDLAVTAPELVEALVLVGPTVDPAARSLLRQALRLVVTAAHERPALDALVVAEYASHPLATLRAARAMLADRIEEKLPSVEAPVLVVRGEHDRIVPQAWAEEVARLARGRLEVLPGGHALNFTSPDELARVVRSFLR